MAVATTNNFTFKDLQTKATALARHYREHPDDALPAFCKSVPHRSADGYYARITSSKFWIKQKRAAAQRLAELDAQRNRDVGPGGRSQYASSAAISRKRHADAAFAQFASNKKMRNRRTGELFRLRELISDNPERQKAAELYAWARGIESLADERGYQKFLLTLTLPAEWHPNPTTRRNSWNGCGADVAARELLARWQKIIQRWNMNPKIAGKYIGLRTIEPHADGCPHLHAVLYLDPLATSAAFDDVADFFDNPSDHKTPGAQAEEIRHSGSSYVYKYVIKNTGADEKENTDNKIESSTKEAVVAWRKALGIRAFQFFGLPARARTSYREYRKAKREPLCPIAKQLHLAATDGDVHKFLDIIENHGNINSRIIEETLDEYGDASQRVIGFQLLTTGESFFFDTFEEVRQRCDDVFDDYEIDDVFSELAADLYVEQSESLKVMHNGPSEAPTPAATLLPEGVRAVTVVGQGSDPPF